MREQWLPSDDSPAAVCKKQSEFSERWRRNLVLQSKAVETKTWEWPRKSSQSVLFHPALLSTWSTPRISTEKPVQVCPFQGACLLSTRGQPSAGKWPHALELRRGTSTNITLTQCVLTWKSYARCLMLVMQTRS